MIWTSVFASYSICNQIATWLIMQSVPELIEEPLCSDINVILTEMVWQYILAVAFSGLVCQHQLYSSQWIMFHWIAQSFEYSKHLITGKQIVSPLFFILHLYKINNKMVVLFQYFTPNLMVLPLTSTYWQITMDASFFSSRFLQQTNASITVQVKFMWDQNMHSVDLFSLETFCVFHLEVRFSVLTKKKLKSPVNIANHQDNLFGPELK